MSLDPPSPEPGRYLSGESLRLLPAHMREDARLYIEEGRVCGDDFILAVASNNLRRSFELADSINAERMHDWVRFFHAYAPSAAWGSPEAVKSWLAMGGLRGLYDNARVARADNVAKAGA
jgi:hypothetical protein